jgi:hypothetical protein
MHELVIEKRPLNNKPLSRDLAELLFDSTIYGKIVVVTDKPVVLHSTIRRRWQHMTRCLHVDRSRTLNHSKIGDINNQLYFARRIRFSSSSPEDDVLDADITFMDTSDCVRVAPTCRTLCIVCDVPKEKLHLMTAWMSKGSRVVLYG